MLFRRKKKEEIIDTRTEIEKKFEERGKQIGAKTGEIVQKTIEQYEETKEKLKSNPGIIKAKEKTKTIVEETKTKFKSKDEKNL